MTTIRFDNWQLELRLKAIVSLLHNAEREGLRISRDAQDIIEHECMLLFERGNVPMDRLRFAALLKETAVRMFRQRRYIEADGRYRMASLFNPTDSTLVSNRATCMYNLKRFERCIDICHACIMSFPTLCFENTLLYFKIIVRLGHANIELENYANAREIYKSLSNLRRHLDIKCGIDIGDDEFQAMTLPFQRHLEASIDTFQRNNPGKPISDFAKRQLPFELGKDGYLYENRNMSTGLDAEEYVEEVLHYDDDSDDGEESSDLFDDNTLGTIEPAHLCCHVWREGTGPCQHMFPEEEHAKSTSSGKRSDLTNDDSDSFIPDLEDDYEDKSEDEEDEEEDGESGTDEDMPALLTCDPDDDESESDEESDSSEERNSGNVRAHTVQMARAARGNRTMKLAERNRKGTKAHVLSSGKFSQRRSSSTGTETLADALVKRRGSVVTLAEMRQGMKSRGARMPTTRKQGFKKGFLKISGNRPVSSKATKQDVSTMSSPDGAAPSSASKAPSSVVLYETDEEKGPVHGICSSGMVEDAVTSARKIFPLLKDDGTNHLPGLISDVLGRKFNNGVAVDALDFVTLFGEHQTQVKSGKKKKRGCDRRCGPCFARKMWKLRFTNRVLRDVEHFLHHLDEDPRVDHDTFLGEEVWQGIGYYGSGHELAFDVPAVVHGVAYIALLQTELRWRGDSITPSMDIQQVFLGALERNLAKSVKGVNFLFMVLSMLKDTITLFDVLSDHRSRGLSSSFQFTYTASEVAKRVRLNSSSNSGPEIDREAYLMSRNDDCIQNANNWGVIGHVEREEAWVYKFLLRDATGLLMNITSRITTSPKPKVQTETFTETFRRLCGDRNDDESQWKHRIVSAMCRGRCRVIERKSASRKAIDLARSGMLLTRAIAARPIQPRLYYKRADVFAYQEKWRECIRDLQKTRMLLGEQTTVKQTLSLLDPAKKLLLLHTYTLEGEAHSAQGRNPGRDQRSHIRSGIDLFSKALEVTPKSKRTRASLQKKLRALRVLDNEICTETRPASVSNQSNGKATRRSVTPAETSHGGARSSPMTAESGLLRTTQERVLKQPVSSDGDLSDSSSDEEARGHVMGNPYAALFSSGASSSSQSSAGPSGYPRSCDVCDVVLSSVADYNAHMNGKRHKSMMGKVRSRGVLREASDTYSSPGSRLGPTRNDVVEQACKIIASQGGQAKLSEIMNQLNFTRWKVRDASQYVDNTFGGLFSVCVGFSHLFQVGAGSSADPVLRLRKASPTVADPAQRHERNRKVMGKTAVRGMIAKDNVRLSETGDFSQMVTDLLRIENDTETKIKSDEEECGICLDNEPDVRCWPCGHVWCDPCMKLYLKKKGTKTGVECPKCRGTIETLHRIAVD